MEEELKNSEEQGLAESEKSANDPKAMLENSDACLTERVKDLENLKEKLETKEEKWLKIFRMLIEKIRQQSHEIASNDTTKETLPSIYIGRLEKEFFLPSCELPEGIVFQNDDNEEISEIGDADNYENLRLTIKVAEAESANALLAYSCVETQREANVRFSHRKRKAETSLLDRPDSREESTQTQAIPENQEQMENEKEIDRLTDKCEILEKRVERYKQMISKCYADMEKLRNEYDSAVEDIEDYEDEIAQLTHKRQQVIENLNSMRKKFQTAEESRKRLEDDLAKLRLQNDCKVYERKIVSITSNIIGLLSTEKQAAEKRLQDFEAANKNGYNKTVPAPAGRGRRRR